MADWKSIVKSVAPALGAAFGGPLGGAAVSVLSEALLGKPDGTEMDIAKAVGEGPADILQKVVNADKEFKLAMEKLGLDYQKLSVEDRANARARETNTKDITTKLLAWTYTAGYFGALWCVWRWGLPYDTDATTVVLTLLGVLTAAQMAVINYYFGSSANGTSSSLGILGRKG